MLCKVAVIKSWGSQGLGVPDCNARRVWSIDRNPYINRHGLLCHSLSSVRPHSSGAKGVLFLVQDNCEKVNSHSIGIGCNGPHPLCLLYGLETCASFGGGPFSNYKIISVAFVSSIKINRNRSFPNSACSARSLAPVIDALRP